MDGMRSLLTLQKIRNSAPKHPQPDTPRGGHAVKTLKETMAEKLGAHQKRLSEVIKASGTKVVDQVTIEQIFSGSRGIHSLLCDTSSVPADKGREDGFDEVVYIDSIADTPTFVDEKCRARDELLHDTWEKAGTRSIDDAGTQQY